MGAAVERHAETGRVSDAAAADVVGRLDHEITSPGGSQSSCRRNSRSAGADNDRIEGAGRRGCGICRTRGERGRGRKEQTAAQKGHTLHYACGSIWSARPGCAQIASRAAAGQMCFGLI